MPFIIWGSRGLTATLGHGEFFCPQCNATGVPYTHKSAREWFTLYFIPVFPIGGKTPYVECHGCRGTFKEEVLNLRPMTEAEKVANEVYEDLRRGNSVQDVKGFLSAGGVDESVAHDFVEKIVEAEGLWTCTDCGNQYIKAVRKCRVCADSRSRR